MSESYTSIDIFQRAWGISKSAKGADLRRCVGLRVDCLPNGKQTVDIPVFRVSVLLQSALSIGRGPRVV